MSKTRLLRALVIVSAAAASLAALPQDAEARRMRIRVGGGIRVQGGISIRVGGGYHVPPPPPPPVPYDCACDYPAPPPQPSYPVQDDYYQPGPTVIVPAHREHRLGLGLFASALKVKESAAEAEGTGALVRFRLGRAVEIEGEIEQVRYLDSERTDTRAGGSLYLNLGRSHTFVPFLVLGAGVNLIAHDEMMDALPQQGYLNAGAGLMWRLTGRLALSGDLRYESLHLAHDDRGDYHYAEQMGVADHERATSARLAAILYF